ncbi:calcium-binding protein [Tardiphaga sp.]|uniref:calcium-binding protein n=1 Tax=Tardiphaga sp. TaxID=1926292 RepID=UPI0037D99881
MIVAGPGIDILRGSPNDDYLLGGDDEDTLTGFLGKNYLDGGKGKDTVRYDDLNGATFEFDGASGAPNSQVSSGGSDPYFGIKRNGQTDILHSIEELYLSDGADTIEVKSTVNLSKAPLFNGGANPSGTSDVLDLSAFTAPLVMKDSGVTGATGTLKFKNFEKFIGSAKADNLSAASSSLQIVDGAGGNDTITGGATKVALIGGDGTDQLFAGSGGAVLDGGVSNGEGDRYVGGKGADVFVIGNGTHIKQGTDAKFNISNAGDDDRLVLRLANTVGASDASALTRGIVLTGGIQPLDWSFDGVIYDTPKVKDKDHVRAVFSTSAVSATIIKVVNPGSPADSAVVTNRSLSSLRSDIGDFTVEYDWDKKANTLDVKITTAYGDFQVHVDGYQNGQLGLTFINKNEPMDSVGLINRDPVGPLQSAWDGYKAAMQGLATAAQLIDLPSPGDLADGNAVKVEPTAPSSGYLPNYGSTFDPAEGKQFDTGNPHDPKGPKKSPINSGKSPLKTSDPIVLDLTGNGLHLTDVEMSETYIDFSGSGFAERTGWVDQQTGILVDVNAPTASAAGAILGAATNDGFGALQAFDTNADGRVSQADVASASLRVWVDANGDGRMDSGELLTLQEAGIASINLSHQQSSNSINGNSVTGTGSFTRADGSIGDLFQVAFKTDTLLTRAVVPPGFTISAAADTLPALTGYGRVADLKIAMTLDPALLMAVKTLILDSGAMSGQAFDDAFEGLVQTWAGVRSVDPAGHDPLVNARHLAMVEKFFGQSFAEANDPGAELDEQTAARIEQAYWTIIDAMKVRFVASLPEAALANGMSQAAVAQHPLAAIAAAIQFFTTDDAITVNFASLLQSTFAAAPTNGPGKQAYFDYVSRVIGALSGDLFGSDRQALVQALQSAASSAGLPSGWVTLVSAGILTGRSLTASGSGVIGTGGDEIIFAGAGNDTLTGGGGADLFVYSSGDGNVAIIDGFGASGLLLTDLSQSDVAYARVGDDLVLHVTATGRTITLTNQFGGNGVQNVSFSDGSELSQWQLAALAGQSGYFVGTAGNDVILQPTYTGETYTLGHGDDLLQDGSSSGSTFVYRLGDGNDTYDVTDTGPSTNRIKLSDLGSSDITFARDADDLIITVTSTGETITVKAQFVDDASGIGALEFADGTVLTRQTINETALTSTPGYLIVLDTHDQTIYGDGRPHSYLYASTSGNDAIYSAESSSKIVFTDIASTAVTLSRPDGGRDLVLTVNSTGKTVTLGGKFGYSGDGSFEEIRFSDGIAWTTADIKAALLAQGTSAPTGSIYGYDGEDDTIVAGSGDKYLNGKGGANTYVYSSAGGNDVVDDASGANSRVVFADIASSEVSFLRQGTSNDLSMTNTTTGRGVLVRGAFYPWNSIKTIQFSDGVTLSMNQIQDNLLAQASAAVSGYVYGYGGRNDTIDAGAGDKYLDGEGGRDVYVYAAATGGNVVIDDGGVASSLRLTDLDATDVTVSRPDDGSDLVISIGATGKTITIVGEFSDSGFGVLKSIDFADGTSWMKSDVIAALSAPNVMTGTIGNDNLSLPATGYTITPGKGDDYLNVTGSGADRIVFARGDGHDVLDNSGSGYQRDDTLVLRGVNPGDVSLTRSGDKLIISVPATGDSFTVNSQFYNGGTSVYGINQIAFADGSTWDRAAISSAANAVHFGRGQGQLTIANTTSQVVFGPGISRSDLIFRPYGSNGLIIALRNSADTITIPDALTQNAWGASSSVGILGFADGSTMVLGQPSPGQGSAIPFEIAATQPGQSLVGSSHGDNVFTGVVGGDITFGQFDNTVSFAELPRNTSIHLNGGHGAMLLPLGDATAVYYQSNGNGDLFIRFVGSDQSITVAQALAANPWGVSSSIRYIGLGNNYIPLGQPFAGQGLPMTFTWYAEGNNFNLGGSNFGSNVFEIIAGGGGISFGNRPDTFNTVYYRPGAGNLDINVNNGVGGITMFGFSMPDVYWQANDYGDLSVRIRGRDSFVLVHNALSIDQSGQVQSAVEYVATTDGQKVYFGETAPQGQGAITFTWLGNGNNYYLGGSKFGSNVYELTAGAGGVRFGNAGVLGTNMIKYGNTAGSADVDLNGATGSILLDGGFSVGDVYLQANGWHDLFVRFRSNPDKQILVHNALTRDAAGHVLSGIEALSFADGTILQLSQTASHPAPITFTWLGSSNNYNFTGSADGRNVFELTGGNGSLTLGASGGNTLRYEASAGSADVQVNNSVAEIEFGSGIAAGDVYLQANGYRDLMVRFRSNPDKQILVHNALTTSPDGRVVSAIDELSFADGTALHLGQDTTHSSPLTFTWLGNGNNYNLTASSQGSNVFEITAGGGSVTLANLTGVAGSPVNRIIYNYTAAYAHVNLNGGQGLLQFGQGITAQDVYLQANGYGDLTVNFRSDGSKGLNFHNALSTGPSGTTSGLTSINFYDGTVLTLGQGAPMPFTWIGGQYASMSGSNFGSNTFEFGAGPETASGGDIENRYLVGSTSGQASIYANQTNGSVDKLDFSGSIEHDDLWFRQSGNDLRIDVVGSNTNATIKDWFAGSSRELDEIKAGGLTLDNQVSQLVQAMASFTSTHPSFDPTSTSASMPQDQSVQSAIAAAWHA